MAGEGFKRKLTAIFSADVIGYSRLMRDDEEATVRDLAAHRVLITEIIKQHNGRVVDSPGDNILAEFASVVDAVNGAIKIQQEIKKSNTETPDDRRMEFRIGINLGDVIEEEERIYGDGVNIAARVEGLAAGGGIAISGIVYDSIKDKLSLGYQYLGEQDVKNIPEPVRIYRLLTEPEDAGKLIGAEKKVSKRDWLWIAAAAAVVTIVGLGIWQFYMRHPALEPASEEKMAFPLPDKPSIAVLAFDNLSGDTEQEYITDNISENIITALSYIPELFVIDRSSSFSYKGKPIKVKEISEELGVRYVLEGSISMSGEKIRITAQLIDALTGGHIWSERYDRDFNDLLNLIDEITLAIITELEVELTKGEQARIRTTDNLDAWRYVSKAGEYFLTFSKEGMAKSRELYKKALEIDPQFAGAVTMMAYTHFNDARFGFTDSRSKSFKRAVELANKSAAMDQNQPLVHDLLAELNLYRKQYDKAVEEGRKSIALGPNRATGHNIFCHVLYRTGYWGSARAKVKLGRESEAQEDFAKFLELAPGWTWESDRRNTLYKPEIIEQEHQDMRVLRISGHASSE